MSQFNFNDNQEQSNFWNYHDPNKEGYAQVIEGDVIELEEVQRYEFGSGKAMYWNDGKPGTTPVEGKEVLDLRMHLMTDDGEVLWQFKPGSRRIESKRSNAVKALIEANGGDLNLENLLGQRIVIGTDDRFRQTDGRPFSAKVLGKGTSKIRGITTWGEKKGDMETANRTLPYKEDESDGRPATPEEVDAIMDKWKRSRQGAGGAAPEAGGQSVYEDDMPF